MLLDFTALSNGSNSSITDDYFQCDNGECIEIRERCNSETDCFDDSDEENCGKLTECISVYRNIYNVRCVIPCCYCKAKVRKQMYSKL